MVDPFCFALKSRLSGIAGRNKLLINMKAHLQRGAFCLLSFGSGFRGEVAASPPFFYWGDARKWHLSHQSLVTPTIRGKESSHMCGMRSFGSVLTCSGWGFSHIERFRPLRMTIREGGWALTFGSRFKVQGSGLRWRLRRLFYWAMLESGILVMGYQL